MAGTKEGGKKAAKANLEKYGSDFYRAIGRKGGRNGNTGGFAANKTIARLAGEKGGRASRRGGKWILYYKGEQETSKSQKLAKEFILENDIFDYNLTRVF